MSRFTLDGDVFLRMETLGGFKEVVQGIYNDSAQRVGITLQFDPNRQEWAHTFWKEDIARLEPQVKGPADHLKRAAFLAFWLRREPPVAIWDDCNADPENYDVEYIMQYGREWCAFRTGYEIALFFECNLAAGGPFERNRYSLSPKYPQEVCTMLKRKNVSPHAMYLIFLSLFNRPSANRLGSMY
ncbi:hypothetical protein [Mesorhizobium sp. M0590]|uniref:hypothetical protein n=1 Tax=unclassified Mesorhizobium TaxID=325217 RepID=UPI00333C0389